MDSESFRSPICTDIIAQSYGPNPSPPRSSAIPSAGLLVQMLIADGLASAGVCICPAAPNRTLSLDRGVLQNSGAITDTFAGDDPYEMTPERFHRDIANTLGEETSNFIHARCVVHESRRVLRDVMGGEVQIDLGSPHAPLLLIGASEDRIISASMVRRNAGGYGHESSRHDYAEFSGHRHYICGEPGWPDVAARVATWLDASPGAGVATRAEAPAGTLMERASSEVCDRAVVEGSQPTLMYTLEPWCEFSPAPG